MNHPTAMLLLSLTVGGCAFSSMAVSAPTSSDGASSAADQVILITPNWKPAVAPREAVRPVEPKIPSLEQKVVQAPSPAIPIAKTLAASPATVAAPPTVITKPVEPVRAPAPLPVWLAPTGSTLQKTVAEWAVKEKYTVIWEAGDLDYPIVSPLIFKGSFEDAVTQIFGLYDKAERSFTVKGWRTQRLIKITERSQVDAKNVGKSL